MSHIPAAPGPGAGEREAPRGGPPAAPSGPLAGAEVRHRINEIMLHTVRYAFEGQARLAEDVGVSRSTVSRLLGGRRQPTYELARRIVAALDAALEDRPPGAPPLDAREVFSPDGTYPTPSACDLCGCDGCLPDAYYDRHGSLRPEYRSARPGDWSVSPLQRADSPAEGSSRMKIYNTRE